MPETGPDRPGIDAALLRQCQLIQLRLLKVFREICGIEHLTYWLDGGTLLGAVRHAGFIPWDDDLDVAMPREDYERFKRTAPALLPHDVFFQTFETDGFPSRQIAKLRDKYSTFIEQKRAARKITYHQGICIDIFPTERIRRDRALCARRAAKVFNWRVSFEKGRALSGKDLIKEVAIFWRDRIMGYEKLFSWYSSLFVARASDRCFYFQIFKAKDFPRLMLSEQDLFPLREVRFEDDLFPAPNDVHAYLTRMYVDYMKLPPPEEQVPHSAKILPWTPCQHKEVLQWK